ncbi:MAG: hypothetical protein V7746_03915 [Halioglobus sp.]
MKITSTLSLAALLLTSTATMADCAKPEAPVLPEGATATMEDMISGQTAVKSFQGANIEYMNCLEASFTAAEAEAMEGSDEEKAAATEIYEKAVDEYNSAVSKEEEVAGQFNSAIRDFKAANPG